MMVPQYWAEGRVRDRVDGHQVTIRRFGWSDVSQEDAQAQADERARETLARFIAGETRLARRERKVPYNGAEGLPIREEIVGRHGDAVITRNSYGARCLNTPDVLFADMDYNTSPPDWVSCLVHVGAVITGIVVGWRMHSFWLGMLVGGSTIFFTSAAVIASARMIAGSPEGWERKARRRIEKFLERNPTWHVRLYRTPNGLRALAMHRTFNPQEPEVAEFFAGLKTDRIYVRMCQRQNCFRARVSPKPWRIGIAAHMKPRPGTWPVRPERMPERMAWVEAYERTAREYAACEFLEAIGRAAVDPKAEAVRRVHDELSKSGSRLPLA
jgi:hypothetical protein